MCNVNNELHVRLIYAAVYLWQMEKGLSVWKLRLDKVTDFTPIVKSLTKVASNLQSIYINISELSSCASHHLPHSLTIIWSTENEWDCTALSVHVAGGVHGA